MIPTRSPEFKVHRTEGLANGALSQRLWDVRCAKYKLGNGIWTLEWGYEPPDFCKCGTPFVEEVKGYNDRLYKRNTNRRITPAWHKGAMAKTWPICKFCQNRYVNGTDRERQDMLDLHRRR